MTMGQVEVPGRSCSSASTLGLLVRGRRGSQVRGAEGGSGSKQPLGGMALTCMRWEHLLLQERGWGPSFCGPPELCHHQTQLSDLLPLSTRSSSPPL